MPRERNDIDALRNDMAEAPRDLKKMHSSCINLDMERMVEGIKFIQFISTRAAINKTVRYMKSVRAGFLFEWTYRHRECFALLRWGGQWGLYTVGDIDQAWHVRLLAHKRYIPYMGWDDRYIYEVTATSSDESFKDLSYCVRRVNEFITATIP
jgi:hypothetical protein